MPEIDGTLSAVRDYYGRILTKTADLKTSACCAPAAVSAPHARILARVHPEVLDRFYGCGSPLPPCLEGCTVLDLGCGAGRDAYLASALVGPRGRVIGIDMTREQLAVAERHIAFHTDAFGYERPNVEFRQGYLEDLAGAGIERESVDVVISNCVFNLSPAKERAFAEVFRVLRPGGELYFSDVFAGRRVPAHLADDPELYGECLAGALYVEDFRRILRRSGILDHRVVERRPLVLEDGPLARKMGNVELFSLTVRAFKLTSLEDVCEDYGQVATYRGSLPEAPHRFVLDDHHAFEAGRPALVCGNTASMLVETRFARHFEVQGDRSVHFGPFACGSSATSAGGGPAGAACC